MVALIHLVVIQVEDLRRQPAHAPVPAVGEQDAADVQKHGGNVHFSPSGGADATVSRNCSRAEETSPCKWMRIIRRPPFPHPGPAGACPPGCTSVCRKAG